MREKIIILKWKKCLILTVLGMYKLEYEYYSDVWYSCLFMTGVVSPNLGSSTLMVTS